MKVLSLYNGISCGRVALERAGIKVDRYISYEIDKYANEVAKNNYPNDEYYGDVTTADFAQYKGKIDIVIGGSPCTYWSIAKKERETTSEGMGYELFRHFVRAIKETGAKYFLYENNHSIHKDIKAEISKDLGVDFIMINSALVSAQQRKRCYWTNIPNATQPEDKGILLKDILESGLPYQDKSHTLTASYNGAVFWNSIERHQRSMVAEPVMKINEATKKGFCEIEIGDCVDLTQPNSKTRRGRSMKEKSNCLTTSPQYYQYIKPVRLGHIGKGGQGDRIYSVKGKSVCLSANGGGRGAKTGLYKIDLPDGEYLVRKLTPVECERLQTLPDGYTEGISNTQRYKALGNGWTVDVISHIFKGLKNVE
jgi:DNA (cytosine-5)-methyltransferase 3A